MINHKTKMSKANHTILEKVLIALTIIYELFLLLFSTLWLFTNNFSGIKNGLGKLEHIGVNETVTYGLFFSGVLGGSFYCLRAMYQRLGEAYTPIGENKTAAKDTLAIKVWIFWYFYRPIQGGVLALILMALVKSNLLVLQELTEDNFKSFYVLIALGFMAGFGSHEVIHKIYEIIKVVFAKSDIKASTSEDKVKENNGE